MRSSNDSFHKMYAHFGKVQFGFDLRRLWNGQNPLSQNDLCSKFWANQNIVSVPTKMEKRERERERERRTDGRGGRDPFGDGERIEEDRWAAKVRATSQRTPY